jgi:hypothetical protein
MWCHDHSHDATCGVTVAIVMPYGVVVVVVVIVLVVVVTVVTPCGVATMVAVIAPHDWSIKEGVMLCSDPTPTFSYTTLSVYTPTYKTPDTWDCLTVVSDFPDVVPAYPLDILPHVAPEPMTLHSLMHSWLYTTHCFTEFCPRRTNRDSTELWLAP